MKARTLNLAVSEEELSRRRAAWKPDPPHAERGYVSMYLEHVQQAHLGTDFDFLVGKSGSVVTRDAH